jgi:hypothetical protein
MSITNSSLPITKMLEEKREDYIAQAEAHLYEKIVELEDIIPKVHVIEQAIMSNNPVEELLKEIPEEYDGMRFYLTMRN